MMHDISYIIFYYRVNLSFVKYPFKLYNATQ